MALAQLFNTSDVTVAGAWIQAAPQWAIFVTILAGGGWALWTARQAKRLEAVRWLQHMNVDFYRNVHFNPIRIDLEHRYEETVGRVLRIQLLHGVRGLDADSVVYAQQVDNYLNYFENLLYMIEVGQLRVSDVRAMYQYWLELMSGDEYGAIRAYAATFGYERLAKYLSAGAVVTVCAPVEEGSAHADHDGCGRPLARFKHADEAREALRLIGDRDLVCRRHRTPAGEAIDVWCVRAL